MAVVQLPTLPAAQLQPRPCLRLRSGTQLVLRARTLRECTRIRVCASGASQHYVVRRVSNAEDRDQVGGIRAEAYFEDRPDSRFVQRSKQQFARQEASSLASRKRAVCLIASSKADGTVVGSVDLYPPGNGRQGKPDSSGGYMKNVAVSPAARRQGIAKLLIQAAAGYALHEWNADALFAHVSPQNEAAKALYQFCGFMPDSIHESDGCAGADDILVRLVLNDDVPTAEVILG